MNASIQKTCHLEPGRKVDTFFTRHDTQKFQDRLNVRLYAKADSFMENDSVVSLNQVHGNRTIIARAPSNRTQDADGVITDVPGLTLTLRTADCQSFVIFAPQNYVVGLLHAGWRGLINGAIPQFFVTLNKEFGIDAASTFVAAGPSLCQKCAEFTDPTKELPLIDPKFFDGRCVDLQGIADAELRTCGVLQSNIERHPDCTCCQSDLYWSYRGGDRDAVRRGQTNVTTCQLKTLRQ